MFAQSPCQCELLCCYLCVCLRFSVCAVPGQVLAERVRARHHLQPHKGEKQLKRRVPLSVLDILSAGQCTDASARNLTTHTS